MRRNFRVTVGTDTLGFSSAHFITYAGHRCEGLHGHNYRVRVTIDGELDEQDHLLFDFIELKRIMQRLCGEIDHLVLLPLRSARIKVSEAGEVVTVAVDGTPRYVFPRRDCALLPIPNTTAEMLAELLGGRLREALEAANARGLTGIEIEVQENVGQAAICRLTLK
jgi:6-pyruvoyltetrahydropterin/6-carboxytetrahydropterin synthase